LWSTLSFKILFVGAVIGEPGMKMLEQSISYLKLKYNPDFIVANGENTRNGKGLSEGLAKKYFSLGVDVITSGNHIWDYANFHATLNNINYASILRPYNYPAGVPGNGYIVKEAGNGVKVGVISLQGRTFMQAIDCPFAMVQKAISAVKRETNLIFIDFHAETTAEKIALGWWLDGQVSAVVGTHTHVQTADERVLPAGTAYITDAGMTGPFDSVIGMRKDVAINRFRFQTPFRYEMATEDLRLNGVLVEIDQQSGKAEKITRINFKENEFL